MTATATRTLKWWTRGEGKRQWPTSALPQQEEWEIVSTAQRWWPLSVTGLGLTLLMPVTAPIVGTTGTLFTVATAWPLLQESRYALQERRFDVAMLSTGAVVGGYLSPKLPWPVLQSLCQMTWLNHLLPGQIGNGAR